MNPNNFTWADVATFYTVIVSQYMPEWTALVSIAIQ